MDQGAYGLSTGLIYVPGSHSRTNEITEFVKATAPNGQLVIDDEKWKGKFPGEVIKLKT